MERVTKATRKAENGKTYILENIVYLQSTEMWAIWPLNIEQQQSTFFIQTSMIPSGGNIQVTDEFGTVFETIHVSQSKLTHLMRWNNVLYATSVSGEVFGWKIQTDSPPLDLLSHCVFNQSHAERVHHIRVWNNRLCTCSEDQKIQIWNPTDGKVITSLSGHTDGIFDMCVYDGNLWSCSRDQTIIVWSPSFQKIYSSSPCGDSIFCLGTWGSKLVSGGASRKVQVWNTSFEVVKTLGEQTSAIWFLQEWKQKLWSCGSNVIFVWNPDTTLFANIQVDGISWIRCAFVWKNALWCSGDGGVCYKISESRDWELERIVWIGNMKEPNCIFRVLPKDIVREVLKNLYT